MTGLATYRYMVVLCCIVGCSERGADRPDAAAPSDATPDRLALGTSTTDGDGFLPLDADQVLVSGPQGGFHVWLKLRITGLAPGPVTVHRTARRAADHRVLLDVESILQVGNATGGTWEQPYPLPLFLCPTPSGVAIVDQRIDVQVTLTRSTAIDPQGEASAAFTVHCPDDARAACVELCSG